jgi:hypothetical protein
MVRKAGTIVKAIGVDQSMVMATPMVTIMSGKATMDLTTGTTTITIIMEMATITVTNSRAK